MAKNSIRDFSSTASSNTDIQSVDIDENCAASGLNNAIRELMADIADFNSGTVGIDVLSLADDDNSAQIKFQAPSAVTTTTTFTLPDGDGTSGQYLQTNGSGTLSWDTVTSSGAYDLNGGELTLDADGDTTIHADTDDQIDFKVGGSDTVHFVGSSVGIGTSSPSTHLHINVAGTSSRRVRVQNNEGYADFGTDANRALIWVSGNQKLRLDSGGELRLNSEGGSVAIVDVRQGCAKHWVNIDIEGTNSTPDSYNHTSFADNGTGKVTINIGNNMNNAGYSPTNSSRRASDGTAYVAAGFIGATFSSSQCQMYFAYANASFGSFHDVANSGTTIHGDLS